MPFWLQLILIIISPFLLLLLSFIVFGAYDFFCHGKFPNVSVKPKRENIFIRLYYRFPKQFFSDLRQRDPNEFREYGFHLICGEQGSGKTVALTELLLCYKKQYPLCKIATNYGYKHQDAEIQHWRDLVFRNNGIYGQIDVIDEIQNWFSSMQSKDFPPEMLQEITQQRKQRKIIFGTAQVFTRVAKPLREQVTFLYKPMTILGCLTIVHVVKPVMDDDGTLKKERHVKFYFFVHSKEIRDSFDTYQKIRTLSEQGFSPRDLNGSTVFVRETKAAGGLFRGKR